MISSHRVRLYTERENCLDVERGVDAPVFSTATTELKEKKKNQTFDMEPADTASNGEN